MPRCRGFTLIEVVVAFAILSLALGALYESFGGALRRSGTARLHELAQLRAESLLSEFRGSGALLPAPRSGHDDDTGFDWRIVAKPYPAELAPSSTWNTEVVEVVVNWDGKGRHDVRLTSIEMLRKAVP
jgi:general secretion pathway protein I